MSNEVSTEVDLIQRHTQSVAGLATQLGYDGTLTVGALEDEIRFYQRRTVEACLELGKRLILLKEMTPHGEFKQRTDMLNINERAARRFMSAALKFSKTDNLTVLKAAGNQSKLLELLVLDDEEIAELSSGGSVNDITLDDIDRMTTSELRKKIREIKADKEATDLLLQKKDQKINELDSELTKAKSPDQIKKRAESEAQQLAKKALEEANTACLTMHNDTVRFTNSINSVLDTINENGLFNIQEQVEAAVVAAFQQIAQTSVELGIQIDFQSMVSPDWMTAASLTGSSVEQ
ncbi:TPA: DUF3102 domain-containing protein [Acinetobacter baumannii]|uniref:DUF3102 domain-containing protein n=1 Tax=Acinetobacter baumannii TaxID=470 RepID=UPI00229BFFE3|nr:DUF3102 domain-containing protein [Acinetobacter baumannii]WFS94041.1 DUF3102 domain-containing protein [Acinetobacter baumannii]WFT25640.1 DUF3102 domain-containing protein [Acinetobacter baumannii]HCA4971331.1 DUF3102 domain-containing protein [Acinetobacter baumannii]HCA5320655.1 DUF3102 domain-containing protein [Acinetobacter baumannii]HCW4387551.1 DUF3102 domain-containing protein [Acinetobacter baumannii]